MARAMCTSVAALALVFMQAVAQSKSLVESDDACEAPKPKRGSAMLQSPVGVGKNASSIKRPAKKVIGNHLVVPLERVAMRSFDSGVLTKEKSFYVGNITIGYPPQRLQVMFDTSSGNVLLPHRVCRNRTCQEHRRYSSHQSLTSQDVDFNGSRVQKGHRLAIGRVKRDAVLTEWTAADLGTGNSKAVLVRDKVCVKSNDDKKLCAWPSVNAAISMDDVPFRAMPSDGVVGLGLLSSAASPTCSFFETLVTNSPDLLPQFGMSFGPNGGGLHIGGYDLNMLSAPLQWLPVHSPEEGFWQIAIQEVRLGNTTFDSCEKGCHAILDTSAARLGVQEVNLPKVQAALSSRLTSEGGCKGPDLEFVLAGFSVKIGSEDYTSNDCAPALGALSLEEPEFFGVYTFGETLLQHYFVAFDWKNKLMGFAPTVEHHSHGGAAAQEQIFM